VRSTVRASLALLAALAAGCAAAPARPSAGASAPVSSGRAAGAPGTAGAEAGSDALSSRTQRLFAEAVQAEEDLKNLKVPTDWPLLERRWRAVLDAAEVPEARFNLGVTLEQQGRIAEARAEYERALAAKPALRQAAVNLGVLLEKQGDARGAQAVYAGVVRDFPEDARARERLAALYQQSGQLDDARRLAREALLRDPRAATANKVLALVAFEKGELDLARLVALRSQKLAPADAELPWLVGRVLDKQGDASAAAAQYRAALELDPKFLPARHALLASALASESWSAVAEQAQAILQEKPDDARVQLALGVALRHLDRADDALAAYAKAEQLSAGKLAEVRLARGVLFLRVKGECEPAMQEFRAFSDAAGPVAATESPVLKLERECTKILEENRKAAEAARLMQEKAQRRAAEEAAKKGANGDAAPAPAEGSTVPTSAPPGKP
jgi:tetratricopeptide (TPR) repeat protein